MTQLTAKIIGCIIFMAFPLHVEAGMTDDSCAACHVMHASQYNFLTGIIDTFTPSVSLLKYGCEGCHTEIASVSIGPAVLNATNDLAGGDFSYSSTNPRMGHNPNEISINDTLATPPGWNNSYSDSEGNQVASGSSWAADLLSCAGKFGCHGNHSITDTVLSLEKAHHNNTGASVNPTVGSATVGGSYRFLLGIKGYEDSAWEASVSSVNRNVYYDEARSGVETLGDRVIDTQTISYLCAQCHGNFHSGIGSAGLLDDGTDIMFTDPWIRHPVGIDMPTTGDYANYTAINNSAPVASSSVETPLLHNTDISGTTNRIVMCLSCHRAHASEFYGSMRWDYRGTPGTAVNGCSVCHSSKQ